MLKKKWYYIQKGKQLGPIPHEEIMDMLEMGSLDGEAYVWAESMEEWQKLKELSSFSKEVEEEPPEIAVIQKADEIPSVRHLASRGRPWVRYWARQLDLLFASMVMCAFIPTITYENAGLFSFCMVLGWVFIESLLLAIWGTTPGKWLLRTKLQKLDGSKISFPQALKRSFTVWIKGMGCGLQFVQIFSMGFSCYKLQKFGVCDWDLDGGYVIGHETIGTRRLLTIICLVLALFSALLAMIVSMASVTDPVIFEVASWV
ncbi:MAG: hypothetical protein ACI9S8_001874 [Chlamydiales bacterium]|jgi:hypothetical protein